VTVIRIRKAAARDLPAIQKLIKANPDTLMQKHLPKVGEFFVAEEAGNIVGCCALAVYSKRLAEVRSLAVEKAHRSNGIASALVAACLKEAKRRKVYEVITITGAVKLFKKQGFGTFHKEKYALMKIL
jgi:amino-acid N-acetyltransferase